MRRRRPMNVQVVEDIDGTRVEIDEREVHAAHVERHDDGKMIVIEHGEEALTVSASKPTRSSRRGSDVRSISG